MIVIISILIILLSMALLYIFQLKRSIKKVVVDVSEQREESTNTLLTTSTQTKEVVALLQEFNETFAYYKKQEVEIERRNKQLEKIIVNISHDLRTPLTSAIGYLEILQSYDVPEEKKKEYQQVVIHKLTDLTKLIEDLFAFTKAITKEEKLEFEVIDINKIFEKSMLSYYQDFVKQNRAIHIEGNQKTNIYSNERMLHHIFDNIIINALKHSHSDVYVTITKNHDTLTYSFMNIVNQTIQVDQIFQEFYTSDISRTKQHTGLGLAIVKEFVEQLGGKVQAKQEANKLYIILSWPIDNKE